MIDTVPYEKLRPVFREKLEVFIASIYANVKPKVINNAAIKGQNFVDLIINYSEAMNNHAVPDITSTWVCPPPHFPVIFPKDRISEKEYNKVLMLAENTLSDKTEKHVSG